MLLITPFILVPMLTLLLSTFLDMLTAKETKPIDPLSFDEGTMSFFKEKDGSIMSRFALFEGCEEMSRN